MANEVLDAVTGRNDNETLERLLQILVRGVKGQAGNGIPIVATQDTHTTAANTFSSADATNGIGFDGSSQNATYRLEIRNSGMNISGAPTLNAFTVGSVLFVGASKVMSQDNSNFFWDDSNNRLGIGNNTPQQTLHVAGNGQVSTFFGAGGAPDTTHALLVSGLTKTSSRAGIGGDPAAATMLKVTGEGWITTRLGIGQDADATIALIVNGTAQTTRLGVGGAPHATETVRVTGTLSTSDKMAVKGVTGTEDFIVNGIAQVTTRFGIGGAPDATLAFKTTGSGVMTGYLDSAGLRATGTSIPATGTGVELGYNSGATIGYLLSFDRGGSAYKAFTMYGLSIDMSPSGTSKFFVDGTGIRFFNAGAGVAKQTVSGTRTGTLAQLQTVMANLLTALDNYDFINDTTT